VSGLLGPEHGTDPEFRRIYDLCAMQRLMQALGAYGKLGHLDRRTEFLEHIPTALPRLRDTLERIAGLDSLRAVLAKLD
jgi:aminoglycoside/choline kinase family phosphotransferase